MGFKIETTQEKLNQAKSEIINKGGRVGKDCFLIEGVSGEYLFEDGVLYVKIIDKPFLVSMSLIQSEFNKFFR